MILRRNRINRNSIKEALDNLQSGVCYFDCNGILILCNHVMYRLAFEIMGKDVQYEPELRDAISKIENNIFKTQDEMVYEFHINQIEGIGYEYIATDITELYNQNVELKARNEELANTLDKMHEMHRNIVAIAREEEILSLKMQIHSNMGKDILRIHKFNSEGCPKDKKDTLVNQLNQTVALLQGGYDEDESSDYLEEFFQVAKAIGADVQIEGRMPKRAQSLQTLVMAMRECLTNTIRHAHGNSIHVSIEWNGDEFQAIITNNGEPPKDVIIEGGGLSGLRQRVEKDGGTMTIESKPAFKLIVTIHGEERRYHD